MAIQRSYSHEGGSNGSRSDSNSNKHRGWSTQQVTLVSILLVNAGMFLSMAYMYDVKTRNNHDDHEAALHGSPLGLARSGLRQLQLQTDNASEGAEPCPDTDEATKKAAAEHRQQRRELQSQVVTLTKEKDRMQEELEQLKSNKSNNNNSDNKELEDMKQKLAAKEKLISNLKQQQQQNENDEKLEEMKQQLATKEKMIANLKQQQQQKQPQTNDNDDNNKLEELKQQLAAKEELIAKLQEQTKEAANVEKIKTELAYKEQLIANLQKNQQEQQQQQPTEAAPDVQLEDLKKKLANKEQMIAKLKKQQEQQQQQEGSGKELEVLGGGTMGIQDDRFTILAHEMPGYTGFARPPYTLAPHYSIVKNSLSNRGNIGKPFDVKVRCNHAHCKKGGALFYLRAYGPAILPGKVTDHGDGTYTFTIIPHDPGQYYYEAILTFSKAPDINQLPVKGTPGEPSYEGYMLPGFPISFQVPEAPQEQKQQNDLPLCTARDMVETSTDSPLQKGRWVLASKTRHGLDYQKALTADYKTIENITLEGYQYSINSVGFQMDYRYTDCHLEPLEVLTNRTMWQTALDNANRQFIPGKKKLHFMFFGDSNIRNQYNFFRDYVAKPMQFMGGSMALTYVEVMKFWPYTWDKARDTFLNVTRDNPDDHFVMVYNVGLHEIANRCALFGQRAGRVKSNPGPCVPFYQEDVGNMTELIKSKPAMVKIWQSTTAGWPKWGVFGVAWPQKSGQPYPMATDSCAHMNKAAWDVVRNAGMEVMDTYWMTLSRPDHREVVDKDASRTSYKLVHMGPEVYLLLLRQVLTIALDALRNGKRGQQFL